MFLLLGGSQRTTAGVCCPLPFCGFQGLNSSTVTSRPISTAPWWGLPKQSFNYKYSTTQTKQCESEGRDSSMLSGKVVLHGMVLWAWSPGWDFSILSLESASGEASTTFQEKKTKQFCRTNILFALLRRGCCQELSVHAGLLREGTSFILLENYHLDVGGLFSVLGMAKPDSPPRNCIHYSESHHHDLWFNQWRNLFLFPRRVYLGIFDPIRGQVQTEWALLLFSVLWCILCSHPKFVSWSHPSHRDARKWNPWQMINPEGGNSWLELKEICVLIKVVKKTSLIKCSVFFISLDFCMLFIPEHCLQCSCCLFS